MPSNPPAQVTLDELREYLRGEVESAEQNYRGSLGRAEELGVNEQGETYRRAAYRSEERAQDFRRYLAALPTPAQVTPEDISVFKAICGSPCAECSHNSCASVRRILAALRTLTGDTQ